jgi:ankyrin repeat protein
VKSMHKCFCLLLLLTSFVHVTGQAEQPDIEDFSKISAKELDEAFITALKKGHSDEVKKLIAAGANVNQKLNYLKEDYDCAYNVTGTPLEYAEEHGHTEIIKALIQAGCKIDDINNALISAAETGHLNIVKELLKASGINVNYKNERADTPLITAIKKGHLGIVKELIQAGANVNDVDRYGNTPLIIAVDHACPLSQFSQQAQEKFVSRWEQRAEIIQILLKKKANVNHTNKDGNTALMQAIENHDFNTVQNILQTPGININQVNNNGDTALIIAIKYVQYSYIDGNMQQYHSCINSQNILEELLQIPGINLFHSNKNGDTAIELLKNLAENIQ